MKTYSFPQFLGRSEVCVALYTHVVDSAALRKRIIDAAGAQGEYGVRERDAVNFAFIDARLITSHLHLQTAIYQAMLAESQNSLRTRTVHSEVLWVLNPTNNITEALRRYGVSDSTRSIIVVCIDGAKDNIERKMGAAVNGKAVPLSTLAALTDWEAIKKYHKLKNESDEEEVDKIVMSMVAMKAVMG